MKDLVYEHEDHLRKLHAYNYVKLSEMGEWVREMGEYLGEGEIIT